MLDLDDELNPEEMQEMLHNMQTGESFNAATDVILNTIVSAGIKKGIVQVKMGEVIRGTGESAHVLLTVDLDSNKKITPNKVLHTDEEGKVCEICIPNNAHVDTQDTIDRDIYVGK